MVKHVENSNIVTLTMSDELKYEELISIKDILAKHHGTDPVIFKLPDGDKILAGSVFWTNATNDLANVINANFHDKVDISIKSMDK